MTEDGVSALLILSLAPRTKLPAPIGQSPHRAASPLHCLPARHTLPAFVKPWHDGVMG